MRNVAPVTHPGPEAQVRALWSAYGRGGPTAMAGLIDDDVEWVPFETGHAVSYAEITGEWGRRQHERISVVVHGFETYGDCVICHGSMRTFRHGGFVDVQPSWVYFFRGERLVRAQGYGSRKQAMAAVAAAAAAP